MKKFKCAAGNFGKIYFQDGKLHEQSLQNTSTTKQIAKCFLPHDCNVFMKYCKKIINKIGDRILNVLTKQSATH